MTKCASPLIEYWQCVEEVITGLRNRTGADAFDDATLFLRAFGHGVVAWLWLDQALAGGTLLNSHLRDGLAYTCRFFSRMNYRRRAAGSR